MNWLKEYTETASGLPDQAATDALGKHIQRALMAYEMGDEPELEKLAPIIGAHIVAKLAGQTQATVEVGDLGIVITYLDYIPDVSLGTKQ